MGKKTETQWQRWQRIAALADVDWRSVRAFEQKAPMRDRPRKRIETVLGKANQERKG